MRYSVLRILLFFGCLLVFALIRGATGLPVVAMVVLAAAASFALSLVVLRGPREEMSARLAGRVAARLPAPDDPASDEAVEDALNDATRSRGHDPATGVDG
jgi:hypothetical protein